MKPIITSIFTVVALIVLSGCQRIHTETSGGGEAKTQVKYEDKYVNTSSYQSSILFSS